MDAKLNIYDDCTGEPVKTYTCKRLILKVSKKVSSLIENMQGKSTKEQEKMTLDVIQTIFPDFKEEDFDGLDPVEWLNFVNEIGNYTNKILDNTQKN